MSTHTGHSPATATASASGTALSTARRTGQDASGIMVSPAEVALLRISAKPGTEGNELILRSGVIVALTYEEAVQMRKSFVLIETMTTDTPHLRSPLYQVVGCGADSLI